MWHAFMFREFKYLDQIEQIHSQDASFEGFTLAGIEQSTTASFTSFSVHAPPTAPPSHLCQCYTTTCRACWTLTCRHVVHTNFMPIMTTHGPSLRKTMNRMSQGMGAQSLASKASQGVMPLVDVIIGDNCEWNNGMVLLLCSVSR
jgi:hypothetical protein